MELMSYKASVRGTGALIEIEIFDYENPLARNPDDASWLKAEVTAQIGPFSGAFRTSVTTYDIAALGERTAEALRSLSGQVSFETTEGDLTLNITFSSRGSAEVEGSLQPNGLSKAALQYRFETEPSALDEMVRGLKAVSERFPAKQIQRQ